MSRQTQAEGSSVTGAALHFNRSAMLFHNAAADRQSQPRTSGMGAESRFKDSRQIFGNNAGPRVPHNNLDTVYPLFDAISRAIPA